MVMWWYKVWRGLDRCGLRSSKYGAAEMNPAFAKSSLLAVSGTEKAAVKG
jgi:hypothetical protein